MASGVQAFIEELFAPLGGVGLRRMFGGFGVFRDGIMFGLVTGDVLYLKTDDTTSPGYEAEGSGPFAFSGAKGREVTTSYWRLPERLYDEPDEFREWARAAVAVAERAKQQKPARKAVAKKKTEKRPAARKPRGGKAEA